MVVSALIIFSRMARADDLTVGHQGAVAPTTEDFGFWPYNGGISTAALPNDGGVAAWQVTNTGGNAQAMYGQLGGRWTLVSRRIGIHPGPDQ